MSSGFKFKTNMKMLVMTHVIYLKTPAFRLPTMCLNMFSNSKL